MAPPWLYWSCTIAVVLVGVALAALAYRLRVATPRVPDIPEGCAPARIVRRVAGDRQLSARAHILRPGWAPSTITGVGFQLGTSRGIRCFSSIEDSVIVLGPPRSGKGLHLAIPMILDAPGAVLTTSTRPDSLAVTLHDRSRRGPVAVFDPQGLAPGIPSATRWSPIRGCHDPHVAMVRAKALTAGTAAGTTDSTFWQASAEQAVRCLLHAAGLGEVTTADLYRWSLSAVQAREATMILATHPDAATAWHQALDAIINSDSRQRDSVWAMVTIAFTALADPKVLDALSPTPGEEFDPETFLRGGGTVYLLGTSTGTAATAGLVAAFVEDVVETARRLAARSPAARLNPPLTLVLDEAANYSLPSLPSLMSDGGGTGISTAVVLQSLAQARDVWGEHAASAIWEAAIVKVILGGGSNARDLQDLSTLVGQRDEHTTTSSHTGDGHRSTSTSTHKVPILEPAALRTLPFSTAILLLRSAPPIHLTLRRWTARSDATQLTADRAAVEEDLRAGQRA
ncbi:TraM recognition domain-containing protein [Dermatophilaceae bacterium Soc4.6]